MSRIGRAPITIPDGVEVQIADHQVVVSGPLGQLEQQIHPAMRVKQVDGQVVVERPSDSKLHKSLHGLTRTLVANMVTGVSQGFEKKLEISGVGYRIMKSGDRLQMQLGFSHPIEIAAPPGIEITSVETFTPTMANGWLSGRFGIRGISKEQVGQLAATIRRIRPAEPYKGKGIRYAGERIRRKAGKTAGKR